MAKARTADTGQKAAELRLDRWLWHARFYKTRALATAAVEAGRVKVNGARPKPSRVVRVGDQLDIAVAGRWLECVVRGIPVRRGPAPEARLAFEETEASVARGLIHAQNQRLGAFAAPRPDGRPDKKERRQLLALGRAQAGGDTDTGPHDAADDWGADWDDGADEDDADDDPHGGADGQ